MLCLRCQQHDTALLILTMQPVATFLPPSLRAPLWGSTNQHIFPLSLWILSIGMGSWTREAMNREWAHLLNTMVPLLQLRTVPPRSSLLAPFTCCLLCPSSQHTLLKWWGEQWCQRCRATSCASCLLKELTECQKPPGEVARPQAGEEMGIQGPCWWAPQS